MRGRRARVAVLVAAAMAACGCVAYRPPRLDAAPSLERARTAATAGMRVTVAVPSEAESAALFGVPLARHGIQPVWLEIENRGADGLWFAPLALDPEYFTPFEAANRCRPRLAWRAKTAMHEHFRARAITPYVASGGVISGFVFTNLDHGVKAVNVALIGRARFEQLALLVPLPDMHADYRDVAFGRLYDPTQIRDVDLGELRAELERLPCCATDAGGTAVEDPLNFVLLGTAEETFTSFVRAGWHLTEVLARRSALKTFASYFLGAEYAYAPISPVHLFGRRQDLSLQKARETARQRNHLRVWLAPLRFAGKPVWVGQISRDIGLAFDWKRLVVHEVDPDVDEARNYLVQDLLRTQGVARFGWVKGVGAAVRSAPRRMADGTPFFTDGLRAVLSFERRWTSLREVESLGWETLPAR